MLRNPKAEYQRKAASLEETFEHIGIDLNETENIFGFLGLEEAEMSPDEAMKILGLTGEVDAAAVKKAYRDASREHHPDLGGDAEMMKKVNAAYEVLQGGGSTGGFKSSVDWEAIRREKAKNAEFIKDYLKKEVKVDSFLQHLRQWEPTLEVSTSLFPEGETRSDWGDHYAGMRVKFKNPSGERSLSVEFIVYLSDLSKTPSLGSDDSYTIPMKVLTSVYVDGKKQKIKELDYTSKSDKALIVNPESVFPSARLNKIFSGQVRKGSKFARRDMDAAIRSELNARVQGDEPYAHIPIGEDDEGNPLEMVVYRNVFMRQPAWTSMGVWRRTGKFQISRMIRESVLSVTYQETYETVKRLKEIQQKATEAPPAQKLAVVRQEQELDKKKNKEALDAYLSKSESSEMLKKQISEAVSENGFIEKKFSKTLYHGSTAPVKDFSLTGTGRLGNGLYLTQDLKMAKYYSQGGRVGGGMKPTQNEGHIYKFKVTGLACVITDADEFMRYIVGEYEPAEEAFEQVGDLYSNSVVKHVSGWAEENGYDLVVSNSGLTDIPQVLVVSKDVAKLSGEVKLKESSGDVTESFTYGLTLRPVALGAVPEGWERYDEYGSYGDTGERDRYTRHGTVTYANELSDEQIKKFELVPIRNEQYLDRYVEKVWAKVGKYADKYLEMGGEDALSDQIKNFLDRFGPIHPEELEQVIARVIDRAKSGDDDSVIIEDFKTVEKKFISQGIPDEEVKEYISKFKSMKDQKIKDPEDKNIDNWGKRSFSDFKDFLDGKEKEVTKTQKVKQQKVEGAELVGENEKWQVYRIKTHKAAQIYGKGTKWCITQDDCEYWDSYIKHSNFYFFISKTREQDDPLYKVAFQDSLEDGQVYWDAEDNTTKKPVGIPSFKREKVVIEISIDGRIYTSDEFLNTKGLEVKGNLDLRDINITSLPEGLSVGRNLDLRDTKITTLPEGLSVGGDLNLRGADITTLPEGLSVGGDLNLSGMKITTLPKGLSVGGYLNLSGMKITTLPEGLSVGGYLNLGHTKITTLPEGLSVGGYLNLGHTKITSLPEGLSVGKDLDLRYTKITTLPEGLSVGGYLNLGHTGVSALPKKLSVGKGIFLDNTNIVSLPKDLHIKGDLFLYNTPITTLPEGLRIDGVLDLRLSKITSLPNGLVVGGSIELGGMDVTLPEGFSVGENLDLYNAKMTSLPDGLSVGGNLYLQFTKITTLPKALSVGGDLHLNNTKITSIPSDAKIGGEVIGLKTKSVSRTESDFSMFCNEEMPEGITFDDVIKSWEEQLPGGLADKKLPSDFPEDQLRMGWEVEFEHTNDPMLALEIAMDHVMEDPLYYTKLADMEEIR